MKNYIILMETGSDSSDELNNRYGFRIVPMHIYLGDDLRDDGSFHPKEEFEFYKRTGTLPKSCGCNVEDFTKIYDEIHNESPDAHILYLAYSSVTTVSFSSGVIAAEGRDYVTCIDTKQCTGGQAFVGVLTARYIKANPEAEVSDIVKYVEDIREKCHMCFIPGDLDYLRAGGRVSNAAYIATRILSIKPVIEVQDGVLNATKRYRGNMEKIIRTTLGYMISKYDYDHELLHFFYSYGLDEGIMERTEKMVKDMGFKEITWLMTGGVISSHSGPGAFGVCGITKEKN